MSEFNKSELLASLIAVNYEPALLHAFAIVTGGVGQTVVASGTATGPAPQVETPAPATNPGATDGQTGGGDVAVDATTLDKRGFPWCAQIHAKSKNFDAKGNWKYAVGIDRENLVPAIEQQLRDQGYGQPAGAPTPAPTPGAATPPPVAQQPGLPPVAGAGGLPPIGTAAPKTKVEFPVVGSEEDMDEAALIQTAAALADKHGNEALKKLLTLFGVNVDNGGTAKDIAAGYKFTFWQYANSDEGLRQQAVIS